MLTADKKASKNVNMRHAYNPDSTTSSQVLDINEKFINACESGDLTIVKQILDNIKDFNVEITDNLGRNPLRLAVENEHLEVFVKSIDFVQFIFIL